MMNNIIQVSPGNRVDFSRIRKALQGTKIPSLQIGGITHLSGDWYNTIFSSFRLQMLADLAGAKTPEEKQAIIEKYNNLQTAYGKLRPQFTDLSSVNFNQDVKDYQDLINSGFNFVNSGGINNGVTTGRYHKVGTANRIGKDLADEWESDGYWAGQTQDRTTLGYKGDWDENSDEFNTWQKSLNDIGMETYLDTDNTYKLRLLQSPPGTPPSTPPNTPPNTPPKTPPTTPPNTPPGGNQLTPVEYPGQSEEEPQSKFRFPTFPLYNAALLGVANITNKRILDTKLKAPSMRYTFTPRVATLERPYVEQQQNEQKLQEYKWDIQQLLDNTNDLGRSQDAYRDVRGKELDTLMQNNLRQSDIYRQSKENVTNTVNYNKAGWDQNANQNRQAWVAEAKDRLNAIAQYQALRGLNLQENIMSNYTDWKAWNRNNQLQDYANWRNDELSKVQQDMNTAYENYLNSGDISKYLGYKDFWSGLVDENGNIVDDKGFGTAYARYLGENGTDTAEARLKFFKDNYQNEKYKNQLGDFIEGWNNYQSDAMNQYLKDSRAIQTRWGLLDSRGKPINFDGEVSSWLYNKMNPRGSYKSIYSMARGGRFLEYLRHNRRAEKEIRDTTMKSMQDSRKLLARDLDALDKESLLLLRAIFK